VDEASEQPLLIHNIYISLGSNIAPVKNLPRAFRLLRKYVAVELVSGVWETPPADLEGPNYLNAVALIHTELSLLHLKHEVLCRIEADLGRVRTTDKNAPRPIDLDIILIDGKIIDPIVWTRAFMVIPLAEISGDVLNPETGETIADVAMRLMFDSEIKARPDVELKP
jgi:2-amino-4-hydroxy-6-hydroxymethyldihydropteridine diphosphokinase